MQTVTLPRQIGILVRSARKRQGFSQKELARRAGVSERLILSLELGDAPGIHLDKLLSILGALNMHLLVDCSSDEKFTPPKATSKLSSAPNAAVELPQSHKTADHPVRSSSQSSQTIKSGQQSTDYVVNYDRLYNELVEATAKDES